MADTSISNLTLTTPATAAHRIPIAITPFGSGNNGYITPALILSYGTSPVAGTTITATQGITTGAAAGTNGSVAFKGSTSGTVTVQPAAAAGTWSLTLPTSAGTNGYVLSTNGSGVTSWIAGGGFDPASPGAIGGTTPAAITGTTITTTGSAGVAAALVAGTAASAVSALDITQTWNYATAAITAIKLNVTNTSSHANALLMDLQVGASTVFNISKTGTVTLSNPGTSIGSTLAPGTYNTELSLNGGLWYINANDVALLTKAAATIGWSSSSTVDGNQHHGDTALSRISAGVIGVGNGTAADFSGTLKLTTLNIASGGSTTISTGVGSVKMSSANAATNTAWIPVQYAGTTYYVPGYTTNSP